MGRKKKRQAKPWCWYCNREFDDEKILIQHQKAKHFKCHICNKKLYTGPGLAIHCMQVHKETIDKIPGAVPGRDSVDVEVYGMEGIPQNYDGGGEPAAKKPLLTPMPMTTMIPPPSVSAPGLAAARFGMPPGMPAPNMMPQFHNPYYGMGLPQGIPTSMPPPIQIRMPTTLPGAPPVQIPLPTSVIPSPAFPLYQPPHHLQQSPPQVVRPEIPAQIPSTSAPPSRSKTRIMVPDENISLEEHMANRLEALSSTRY